MPRYQDRFPPNGLFAPRKPLLCDDPNLIMRVIRGLDCAAGKTKRAEQSRMYRHASRLIQELLAERMRLNDDLDDILNRSQFVVIDREEIEADPDLAVDEDALAAIERITKGWPK